ncbi:MAG: hypothetical protein AAB019_05155 [Planctomycetota bacterium]
MSNRQLLRKLYLSLISLALVFGVNPNLFSEQPLSIDDFDDKTDIVTEALKTKGLTRETARFDVQTLDGLLAQQPMVQAHFSRYWKNPWDFPKFVYALTDSQIKNVDKPDGIYQLFAMSTIRSMGRKVTAYLEFAPAFKPKTDNPILEALEGMSERCGAPITDPIKDEVFRALKGVPPEVQLAIAKFIYAAGEAKFYRDRALRHYPKEKWPLTFDYAYRNFSVNDEELAANFVINWDLGKLADFDDLYTGAVPNLLAIMDMEAFLNNPVYTPTAEKSITPTESAKIDLNHIAFEFNTLLGKVAFNGKQENNTYQGDDYLLIVDLAGNDTYKGATAASWKLEHPVSTVIDWSGDDSYIADEKTPCAQGAGVMGYGFLIDNGGNDIFKAVNSAQGMCYFGVGVLIARGGDDTFDGRFSVQGAASFGTAYLIKKGGNDKYYAYHVSQGFGFTGGYGCLIDTGGNDKYVAEPYKIFMRADGGHDNLRNYSFCQGMGFGQRGDIAGGHSMAGGTGLLQDLAGDDWYEGGVYAQASAYWYATGILHDKAGNDHYEGSFFVQSSGVHMGLTMLLDEGGNDTYHAWKAISQAGAHDVSVSWLVDKGGDNRFSAWSWLDEQGAPTLIDTGKKGANGGSLTGSAVNNSVVVFISAGGNDTYEFYTKDTLSRGFQNSEKSSWRYDLFNIALFIDIGGEDKYNLTGEPEDWPKVANDTSWSIINQTAGNPDKTFSMGIDTPKGTAKELEK